MKTFSAVLLLVLASASQGAAKSVPVELISTVVGETIKSRIPNPADPKLLAQMIYDISMGKPERVVDQAFESYKPGNIKNDAAGTAQFEMLKLLLPVVGVYAETAKQVYGVVETYVNDWQDWAIKNRATEFNEEVLTKTTVAELDKAWNEFYYGRDQIGGVEDRMLGVLGANRAEVVKKMKDAYQQRRAELELKERFARVMQERVRAKIEATQQLLSMKDAAERKVADIMEMLETLKVPAPNDTVEKYIQDKRLYAELSARFSAEIAGKTKAGEAVKTGDPQADTLLNTVAQAQKEASSNSRESFKLPDYSGILREHGLNSDRLLTNDVAPDEYQRLKNLLYSSAREMNDACMAPYYRQLEYRDTRESAQNKINACNNGYKKFADAADEIQNRLNDYGTKLVNELGALTMKGPGDNTLEQAYSGSKAGFYALSQAKNLENFNSTMYSIEIGNNHAEDLDHWEKWSWPGKKNPDLKTMEKYRDNLAAIAAAYETLAPEAEERARAFNSAADEYEKEYKDELNRYSDLYRKNSALAELYGIEMYDFKAQLRQFSFARTKLDEPFMSSAFIAEMRGRGGKARALQTAWNSVISANRKFLADFGGTPGEMADLAKWRTKTGVLGMTKDNFDKYYAEKLQAPLAAAACSTYALEESRTGVFDKRRAADGGCLLSLAEHQKNLSALEERLQDAASMDFYAKRDAMNKKMAAMGEAADNPIRVAAAETQAVTDGADKIMNGFVQFSKVSHENLLETYNAYKERLARAREIEGNMLNWSCASSSEEDNKKFIADLPWKVSPEVEKFCLDEKSRPAPGGSTGGTPEIPGEAEAKRFYEDFTRAYESRNAPAVMALISPDWEAGSDGTGVTDLEENLRTNFRLYDIIKFSLSGLTVTGAGGVLQA